MHGVLVLRFKRARGWWRGPGSGAGGCFGVGFEDDEVHGGPAEDHRGRGADHGPGDEVSNFLEDQGVLGVLEAQKVSGESARV